MPARVAFAVLAALALSACGPRSQVLPEEAVAFRQYRHIAVPPFTDKKGKGKEIAAALDTALQQALFEPVDQAKVAEVLEKHKPDREFGLDIEALEALRGATGADAVVFGRMTPDWSAATLAMVEANMGDPILHAVLRPRHGKKTFTTPDEIAQEFMRVYTKLK